MIKALNPPPFSGMSLRLIKRRPIKYESDIGNLLLELG